MDIIGVYIADIITTATLTLIATTATITIIVACIITITAIGETNRVVRQQTSSPQGKGRSTRCGLFPSIAPNKRPSKGAGTNREILVP
jgi:hypothetical protein